MKLRHLVIALLGLVLSAGCKKYESVDGDPMGVRIYTLDNGLKVYTCVNHDQPRISAYVCVRAGSKNDPLATTGLAHYLEHLMFKGTEHFGTIDYAREKPLLDSIENLYEQYNHTTDETQRRAIYRQIDAVGYEASKLAIPNEYDKLMATIGSTECNAFTSYDMTCYVEDVPANQLANWVKIQAERFRCPVLRGFHTELETVYEEYNMYASDDDMKTSNALNSNLFPGHSYGRDVIGLPEHLKNPSIKAVKRFYEQWYVPNNMAIVLSGDFDPDEAVKVIEKQFGNFRPNKNLQVPEQPLRPELARRDTTVYGLESEYVKIGWRLPSASSEDAQKLEMLGSVLSNGTSGLIDLDLNQPQRVNDCSASVDLLADYGSLEVNAYPKEGQTLEEVRALILQEIAKLRRGDFSDDMLAGVLANYRLGLMKANEDYESCAYRMLSSFCLGTEWASEVKQIEELEKLTKKDIQDLAAKYLADDACVTVYKRQSESSNQQRIEKPQLTPIEANRDTLSQFLRDIQQAQVAPIEPQFVDFGSAMSVTELQAGQPLLYKENTLNGRFQLSYVYDMGVNQDSLLNVATTYLDYLGTSHRTAAEVKTAFYQMACNFNIHTTARRTFITLEGLDENMDQAVQLLDELLNDAQVDSTAYAEMVSGIIKSRRDAKTSKDRVSQMLRNYLIYGPHNPFTHSVSNDCLRATDPQTLVDRIKQLSTYKHRVMYYGPRQQEALKTAVRQNHVVAKKLCDVPQAGNYLAQPVDSAHVYLVDYDDNQSYLCMYCHLGQHFDVQDKALRDAYDNYFGYGSMNCIVFQELRERRSLAYSAGSYTAELSYADEPCYLLAHIGTQTDKLLDATEAFSDLLRHMPESEPAFAITRESLLTTLRTARVNKEQVLWHYLSAQDLGLSTDKNQQIYEAMQSLTLKDVVAYQKKHISARPFIYGIVARRSDLDMASIQQYGPVTWLTLEDIFGY